MQHVSSLIVHGRRKRGEAPIDGKLLTDDTAGRHDGAQVEFRGEMRPRRLLRVTNACSIAGADDIEIDTVAATV